MRSVIPHERLENLRQLADDSRLASGWVVEVGVYQGGSAAVLAQVFGPRSMLLYDTFSGLPEPRSVDGPRVMQGQFGDVSVDAVRRLVPHARIIVGPFDERFVPDTSSFAFVHIDVDLYFPTLDALLCFWPRLSPGGRIVVDDAGNEPTPGATEAVKRWLATVGLGLPAAWQDWPSCGGWTIQKPRDYLPGGPR